MLARRATSAMAAGGSLLLLASTSTADWPVQRHDPARTGIAGGTSNMQTPAVFFRYYLGGSIGPTQLLTHDVDSDGTPDIVYTSGGSVIAKRSNDTIIWKTRPTGFGALVGIDDLDGDGKGDIVVYTSNRAVVLEAATGVVQWVEPEAEMGTLSGVAIGDLDGDALPDLLMQECGCCGVNSGNTGYVYSFANGFGAPKLLSELPYATCGAARSLALIDSEGQGPREVLNNTNSHFYLVDGKSGQVVASSPNIGTWTASHNCRGHDVDGLPGEEILCVQNVSTQPATSQRKITVLKRAGGALNVLWSKVVAPDAGGDMAWIDPFVDLDGDGNLEVVVGTKDPSDVWTTRVFAAQTGAELASVPGVPAGTAAVEVANKPLVLTESGTTLTAYAFENASLAKRWELLDRATLTERVPALQPVTSLYTRTLTIDLDGDGVDELVTRNTGGAQEITAYKASNMTATKLASYALPAAVDVIRAWVLPPIDVPQKQLAVARNDGFLVLLNNQLVPTNAGFGLPGIRIGGYYASGGWRDLQTTPAVAALDAGPVESIVARDSRAALLRLDASQASMSSPPAVVWQRTHTFGASIFDDLDGPKRGVVAFAVKEPVTAPPAYRVVGLKADGSLLFEVPLEGQPINDILPGDVNQDGTTDLLLQWGNPSDTLQQTRALSGLTGATLWNAAPIEAGCGRQPAGLTASDHDGDGVTDVLLHASSKSHVLGGKDGVVAQSSVTVGGCYHLITAYDTDGDNTTELTLHGSNNQPRTLSHDLQTLLWSGGDNDKPYPYAAVAPCQGGPVLVEGSWEYPARLKVTRLSGPKIGSYFTMVLAGGQKFVSESAAQFSGKYLGQLTSATVHQDLTGKKRPTATVGSADGWLYAVDPCSNALDFSVDFGTAVGEVVFGDTDGDGRDEILVTAADGFLYGLKNESIVPPADVLDTDPDNGITGFDVDNIVTADKLSAVWIASPGAAKYQVAIVEDGAGYVSNPIWQDVGNVTSASVAGLPLSDGGKYYFVVRAVHPNGDPSVDVISDGVIVKTPIGTGGGGTGGAAGAGGGGTGGTGAMGTGGADGGSGGAVGGAGGATAPLAPTAVDSGCGCELPGGQDQQPDEPHLSWWLLLGLAALARRTR